MNRVSVLFFPKRMDFKSHRQIFIFLLILFRELQVSAECQSKLQSYLDFKEG